MHAILRIRTGIFSVVIPMISSVAIAAGGYAPKVGEPHGNLILPRVGDRSPLSLADLRGTKVLLIHFASW